MFVYACRYHTGRVCSHDRANANRSFSAQVSRSKHVGAGGTHESVVPRNFFDGKNYNTRRQARITDVSRWLECRADNNRNGCGHKINVLRQTDELGYSVGSITYFKFVIRVLQFLEFSSENMNVFENDRWKLRQFGYSAMNKEFIIS